MYWVDYDKLFPTQDMCAYRTIGSDVHVFKLCYNIYSLSTTDISRVVYEYTLALAIHVHECSSESTLAPIVQYIVCVCVCVHTCLRDAMRSCRI